MPHPSDPSPSSGVGQPVVPSASPAETQSFSQVLGLWGLGLSLALCLGACSKEEKGTQGQSAAAVASSNDPLPGYTLIEQLRSPVTSLIDMAGKVVHSWTSASNLGGGSYVLTNGDLLRSGLIRNSPFNNSCPGLTGLVEDFDWDGKLKWSYTLADATRSLHHDIHPLPNGNVLMLGVEAISKEQQIEMGRDPARVDKDLWLDFIMEVKPTGATGGEVVWEWHLADHLIQEFDPKKKNYAVVADHPELLDVNCVENLQKMSASTLKNLQAIGYVGQAPAHTSSVLPDWTHMNSITYSPELDQVLVSVRSLGEVWILDHSPNTDGAKTHAGGKGGKGGDILYRWGNPQNYQRGTVKDQRFFGQHNATWIPEGSPGAGHILVFNNGEGRKDGSYSTIEEIIPSLNSGGSYEVQDGLAFGPAKTCWAYEAEPKTGFDSNFVSGVNRLSNGNTLICSGVQGRIFEVNAAGKILWEQHRTVEMAPPGRKKQGDGGAGPMGQQGSRQGGPGGQGGPGARGPGGGGGRMAGPGGGGGARGGRRSGGGAIGAVTSSASLIGTGQVAAFGVFEFFKVSAVAQQGQGASGPASGATDPNAATTASNAGPRPGGPGGQDAAGGAGRPNAPAGGGGGAGALFRAEKYPLDYPGFKGRNLAQK